MIGLNQKNGGGGNCKPENAEVGITVIFNLDQVLREYGGFNSIIPAPLLAHFESICDRMKVGLFNTVTMSDIRYAQLNYPRKHHIPG